MSDSPGKPVNLLVDPGPGPRLEELWRQGRQPDVQEFLKSVLNLSPVQVVEVLCVDQWERWQQGQRIPAEAHLKLHPALQAGCEEGFDLVYGEFLLREERGESPKFEEFLERFPQYASQLQRQLSLHRMIETDLPQPQESGAHAREVGETSALPPQTEESPSAGQTERETTWPRIPGYEILGELGRGGMGRVFKAVQQRLNRVVALKVVRPERLEQFPDMIHRFQREARAAARLSHPNIVMVYDADRVGDTYFIAMEYVEGIDLNRLVEEHGPLPVEEACEYVRQAALGLQHAHEHQIVHRDIKPGNLLVTAPRASEDSWYRLCPVFPPGPKETPGVTAAKKRPRRPLGLSHLGVARSAVVKILDMGLARMLPTPDGGDSIPGTLEGIMMGTPDFLAPEQARNSSAVDIRADLYSLGCTFYFLLAGRSPFAEQSFMAKLMMHQTAEPKPIGELRPEVSPSLQKVLAKLIAKDPSRRYQTPVELSDELALMLKLGTVCTSVPGKSPAREANQALESAPAVPPRSSVAPQESPAAVQADPDKYSSSYYKWVGVKKPVAPAEVPQPQKIVVLEGHRGWVTSVAFAPDRGTLASGGVDGAVRLWDLAGDEPRDHSLPREHPSDVQTLAFAPDSKTLASGAGTLCGIVHVWNCAIPEPRKKTVVKGEKAAVDVLAFSTDSKLLGCALSDKNVYVWDVTRPQPRLQTVLKGHAGYIRTLAFAPGGETVVTGSLDETVRLWDLNRLWSKEQHLLTGGWGPVHALTVTADGAILAFGGLDQTVRLWDITGARPQSLAVLRGHLGVIRLLQFTGEDQTLLSVCDGGRLIHWNMVNGTPLQEWQLPRATISSLALTHDGRYLATGNSDGSVFLFRLYPCH